jgi:tRNA(fMet)-specific endonuclease VapC
VKLLDTGVCIHLLNAREPELLARFRAHPPVELALSTIVRAELLWGARNSGRIDENLERVRLFAEPLVSLLFDDESAERYGAIRADLAARGTPIGPNDLLIAATALGHRATLVTRNRREFERVSGLAIEAW